jgi:hypothetical protein
MRSTSKGFETVPAAEDQLKPRQMAPGDTTVGFTPYCSGILVDFQPPACVIAAKSMSS